MGQDDVPAQDHVDSAVGGGDSAETDASVAGKWVGTWACGPQLTETANLPPAPGLSGNTLRQIVYVSIPGTRLRVQLSNAFGDGPVTMNAVHLAVSTGAACSSGALTPSHVLTAMGINEARARGSVRFSLGHYNTDADVDVLLEKLTGIIAKLRA